MLVEKTHLWASKKPSKGLLERAFYDGELAISARSGMLKTYELIDRHFGWEKQPAPARRIRSGPASPSSIRGLAATDCSMTGSAPTRWRGWTVTCWRNRGLRI